MIPTPTIYAQNEAQISNDLLPPFRRLSKWLAWFIAILTPLQWLHDLVFTDYYGGSTAADWANGNTYNYGDRVKYIDNAIYESVSIIAFVSSTAPSSDLYNPITVTGNWIKVLDTFVGVAERVKYNGQLIMMEYLLNKYFSVGAILLPWSGASHVNQIYITRNTVFISDFWMADSTQNQPNSYMADDSKFSTAWMPDVTGAFQGNSFTIYVPAAVATSITASIVAAVPGSLDTYATLITSIINNYIRAGKMFNITTY